LVRAWLPGKVIKAIKVIVGFRWNKLFLGFNYRCLY